jgi:hypothetical protein
MTPSVILEYLILLLGGFLIGSFIPLALLYLIIFVKKHRFSLRRFLGLVVRIILIPIVFIIVMAAVGLIMEWSGITPGELTDKAAGLLGSAAMFGLIGGSIAFLIGLKKGRGTTKRTQANETISKKGATMAVEAAAGDVFLTRGHGFLSKAIRFCTRGIGEKRSKVNHVGVVVVGGNLEICIVVEALTKVKRHRLLKQYGPPKKDGVAIYRPTNLTEEEIAKVVATANEMVDQSYGYLKILAHLLDWLLFGIYFFRWFGRNGKYPICSWLVAYAFEQAGKHFGVKTGMASPDDIWDFIEENPDKYEQIHPLEPLGVVAGPEEVKEETSE